MKNMQKIKFINQINQRHYSTIQKHKMQLINNVINYIILWTTKNTNTLCVSYL